MPQFTHLHVHSQFSLLDGAASIKSMVNKAKNDGMTAMAITDHGNMFGAFNFVAEANAAGIKPILGCEFYLVENRHIREFKNGLKDNRLHQLLLAKDEDGYKNLSKLCSLGFIEGSYGKYPRIDKELIKQYHKGLIATSCCIGAEIPQAIMYKGEAEAEEKLKWWMDIFGEDYYIEIQRHDIQDFDGTGYSQEKVNQILLGFAKKYDLKVICTNDSHYLDKEDFNAHDILLCVNTGEKMSTPKGHGKGYRFGFPNDKFYFKTQSEMNELFKDVPESVDNTNEIVDKISEFKLKKDIALPNFIVPEEYKNDQNLYLRALTYQGAAKKYGDVNDVVRDRIEFELNTISTMGFAGYFLIVADFIREGKDIGVFVGPGRGSAAGSVVAYCTDITNIDPIKYDLLFERFLNPDRKSMPDIDTDFDDEGRQKVIDYVVAKYGKNQVAQIVTFGTMASKSSIKDVARVMDLPLSEANYLAKLLPDRVPVTLKRALLAPLDGPKSLKEEEGLGSEDLEPIKKLREIYQSRTPGGAVLKEALKLEGSVRGTGIHAAGVIIAPTDLTDLIPVCTAKDSDLLVTQFEGKIIESAGVIKMDFLGLRNLTILRDALQLIKQNTGEEIDIVAISLEDEKTLELYQKGNTAGTFQFESAGMQKYLKDLKPDRFGDLIAMNALYRPGPLQYIPSYINRKHGREAITYDLPIMEELLSETYGITVYQEQVMLLSQKMANFTKGDADVLRKAMGKKDRATLDKMRPKFLEGCVANGLEESKCEKVWKDWEAFAAYAFNKSHSTCYAYLAFQTAYLKVHYPAEYMAAVLTSVKGDIDKISYFMDECKKMGVKVLGPDVNESDIYFSVNKNKEVRFGLGAIKGTGGASSESILEERNLNGAFVDIFDFAARVNLSKVNKKSFEALTDSGAFDCFEEITREQLWDKDASGATFIEKLLRFGQGYQASKDSALNSLFGGKDDNIIAKPRIPALTDFSIFQRLKREKDAIGMFLSGHPLDDYGAEILAFTNSDFARMECLEGNSYLLAGIVTEAQYYEGDRPNGRFKVEDFVGTFEFRLFKEPYVRAKPLLYVDSLIYFRVTAKRNFRQEVEFEVSDVQLLSDILNKKTSLIRARINLQDISEDTIKILSIIEKEHIGKTKFTLDVYDLEDQNKVELHLAKFGVNPTKELLNLLFNRDEIEVLIK